MVTRLYLSTSDSNFLQTMPLVKTTQVDLIPRFGILNQLTGTHLSKILRFLIELASLRVTLDSNLKKKHGVMISLPMIGISLSAITFTPA